MKEALKLALEALESCDEGDWSTGHVIHPSYDEDAVKQAIIAIEEALAQPEQIPPSAYSNTHQPEPPPECQTEEEKTAFAFGWFKAMESHRVAQQSNEQVEPCRHRLVDVTNEVVKSGYMCMDCGAVFGEYTTHPPVPTAQPETPYKVGQRIAKTGGGMSHLWSAVSNDGELAEAERGFKDAQPKEPEQEPSDLTIAYMAGFHDGKKCKIKENT